jgi:hypothetical protein
MEGHVKVGIGDRPMCVCFLCFSSDCVYSSYYGQLQQWRGSAPSVTLQ